MVEDSRWISAYETTARGGGNGMHGKRSGGAKRVKKTRDTVGKDREKEMKYIGEKEARVARRR